MTKPTTIHDHAAVDDPGITTANVSNEAAAPRDGHHPQGSAKINTEGEAQAATSIHHGDSVEANESAVDTSDEESGSIPRNEEERRTFNLQRLAGEIRDLHTEGRKRTLLMAEKVREARQYFEETASGTISWTKWVSSNLPFEVSRANQLLQIAVAPDPEAELDRQLAMGAERQARKRAKDASPLRNGRSPLQEHDPMCDEDGSDDVEQWERPAPDEIESEEAEEPERKQLREWVEVAPVVDLKRVIKFLKQLGEGPEEYDLLVGEGTDIGVAEATVAEQSPGVSNVMCETTEKMEMVQ